MAVMGYLSSVLPSLGPQSVPPVESRQCHHTRHLATPLKDPPVDNSVSKHCTLQILGPRLHSSTVRVLKTDAGLRKRFSELRLRRDLFRKPEGFFRKSEGFFRKSEGFFRKPEGFFRRHGRRGRLFPKTRKASSTDAEGSEFRSDHAVFT